MTNAARHLLDEALRLPLEERSELAAKLLRSLDDDEGAVSPEEWDRAWGAEITRRMREIDEGLVQAIDADEALARARTTLKRPR